MHLFVLESKKKPALHVVVVVITVVGVGVVQLLSKKHGGGSTIRGCFTNSAGVLGVLEIIIKPIIKIIPVKYIICFCDCFIVSPHHVSCNF